MITSKKVFSLGTFLSIGILALHATCEPITNLSDKDVSRLTVVSNDQLGGRVTSMPGGIDCGPACSAPFIRGTQITLTLQVPDGTEFTGWDGGCSGTDPVCTLTLTSDTRVGFTLNQVAPLSPSIASISPQSALNTGGSMLTLNGSNFASGATVTVGGNACTNPTVTASQITCTIPAKAATCGTQAVQVTNPDQRKATSNQFRYRPAAVVFGTPTNLTSTGMDPIIIVAADFNKDGKLDLASANRGSDNVSLYINNGSGGFGAATNFTVGTQPTSLVVVDLNKDTNPDLVLTNAGSDNISFLAGNGSTGFANAVNTAGTFAAPQGVVAGDFDKDGNPDIAVANTFSSNLVIFTGDGLGALTEGTAVTVGSNARYLAVADLNKDGDLDVVTPNVSSNSVSYRPGGANATFGAGMDISVAANPPSIVIADVNGDQNLDIVVPSEAAGTVTVLLGNGAGLFTAATGSPFAVGGATPQGLSVVDMDGDGKLDIVTANYNGQNVSILAGDGAGSFSPITGSPFAAGAQAWGLVTADFNGDGLIDVATANRSASVAVRLATCN